MKSHLKVKVHSLSHEMRYIRRQENKWKERAKAARQRKRAFEASDTHKDGLSEAIVRGRDRHIAYAEGNFWSLRTHRTGMKVDARNSHLAYGCMRGMPYSRMEHLCYGVYKGQGAREPQWSRIEAMVQRFSKDEPNPQDFMQRFAQWLESAKLWYEGNESRIPAARDKRNADAYARLNNTEYQAERKKHSQQAEEHGRMVHNAAYT